MSYSGFLWSSWCRQWKEAFRLKFITTSLSLQPWAVLHAFQEALYLPDNEKGPFLVGMRRKEWLKCSFLLFFGKTGKLRTAKSNCVVEYHGWRMNHHLELRLQKSYKAIWPKVTVFCRMFPLCVWKFKWAGDCINFCSAIALVYFRGNVYCWGKTFLSEGGLFSPLTCNFWQRQLQMLENLLRQKLLQTRIKAVLNNQKPGSLEKLRKDSKSSEKSVIQNVPLDTLNAVLVKNSQLIFDQTSKKNQRVETVNKELFSL